MTPIALFEEDRETMKLNKPGRKKLESQHSQQKAKHDLQSDLPPARKREPLTAQSFHKKGPKFLQVPCTPSPEYHIKGRSQRQITPRIIQVHKHLSCNSKVVSHHNKLQGFKSLG